jgi:hypothetical protein
MMMPAAHQKPHTFSITAEIGRSVWGFQIKSKNKKKMLCLYVHRLFSEEQE